MIDLGEKENVNGKPKTMEEVFGRLGMCNKIFQSFQIIRITLKEFENRK